MLRVSCLRAAHGTVGAVAHLSVCVNNIHYRLKTPYRDGTTHVVFEPPDFIVRLAALVPNPRVNLTRYHGVFAPNHHLREQVTPARRGRRHAVTADQPPADGHAAMTWRNV